MSELQTTAEFDEPLADRQERSAALIPPTDGERLMRFQRYRDESAFAELVETHAKMVWGVCAQILRHQQDVEDAFQATFLILARKAKSIRAADNAAGWLYRVAFRTALLARDRRNRRNEAPLDDDPRSLGDQLAAVERSEQCFALLEELNALPARYRQPLVLCYMEGRTRREAADELGVTSQTVKGLLARGTRMLRSRLARRGTALSIAMGAATAALAASQAAATPTLVATTASLGASFALKAKLATSGLKGSTLQGAACTLAEKGLLAMTIAAASKPAVGLLGICLAVGMLAAAEAEPTATLRLGGAPTVLYLAADDRAEANGGDEGFTAVLEGEPGDLRAAAAGGDDAFGVWDEPAMSGNGDAVTVKERKVVEFDMVKQQAAIPAKKVISFGRGFHAEASSDPFGGEVSADGDSGLQTYQNASPAMPGQPPMVTAPSTAWNQYGLAATIAPSQGASAATLKLEQEYWNLKAQGLKKKAEAIQAKYEVAKKGKSAGEVLELAAEHDLTLAEVKLCEMNAQRVKETIRNVHGVVSILHQGDKGEEVLQLQMILNAKLSQQPPLEVDGDFGVKTKAAVMAFQREHKLQPTGQVDEETKTKLGMNLLRVFPVAPPRTQRASVWMQPPGSPATPVYAGVPSTKGAAGGSQAISQGERQFPPGTVVIDPVELPKRTVDQLKSLVEKNQQLQQRIEQLERAAKEADAKSE